MCNAAMTLLLLYFFAQLVTFELDRRATSLKITEVPGREAGKRLVQLAAISFLLFFLLPISLPDDSEELLGVELSLLYTLSWFVCPGIGTLVGIAGFFMYFAGDTTVRSDRFVLTETDTVATLKGGQIAYTILKQPPLGQSVEQECSTQLVDVYGLLALINSAAATTEARIRHKVNLQYHLDAQATDRFLKLNEAFEALFSCSYVWSVQRDIQSRDQFGEWNVRRDTLAATKANLPFMTVGLEHIAFQVTDKALLFLPDYVYSYDSAQGIRSHRYSDVKIKTSSTEFTEQRYYVQEAPTLWRTWLHTRKDGGPDRRYKYNPVRTRVVYGVVEIRLEPDVYWLLMVTSLAKAEEFCARFYGRYRVSGQRSDTRQQAREESGRQRPEQTWPYSDPTAIGHYAILRLDMNATEDEIKAAYRRLAKMNHPDMVSGLDPQFRELAEARMKEINEAYDYIIKRCPHKDPEAPG